VKKQYIVILFLVSTYGFGQVDISGYFEAQYTGFYLNTMYFQQSYTKLRVDLKSTAIKNTEFGADVIDVLYFGAQQWNILDFLPERIASAVPPELYALYEFALRDTLYLDNAYARLSFGRCAVTAGKQQISLGTGYFTNPIDVFNTKDALDPTYEQPGHYAVRLDWFPGSRFSCTGMYTPVAYDWAHSGKLVRAKLGLGHFDMSVTGYQYQYKTTDFYTFSITQQRRTLFGTDVVGQLLGLGVWGEGAYNVLDNDDDFLEFVVGGDYTFESGLYTMIEYHHNSLGKSNYQQYDLNDWMRFITGETKTIAQDQVYGLIQYPITDLILIGGSVLFCVSDQSVALVPMVYYSIFENVDLTCMLNVYVGEEGKNYSGTLGSGGFIRANVYF
jgi:hypothetical protein